MKWSERGPIPWPFVRRSRFVKELERQGDAYRKNVSLADNQRWCAERELALAREEFDTTLRKLQGWWDDGAQHIVQTHDPNEIEHFRMELVPEHLRMSWSFVFRMSDQMMMQMIKRLDPVTARHAITMVAEKLAVEAIQKMYEDGAAF